MQRFILENSLPALFIAILTLVVAAQGHSESDDPDEKELTPKVNVDENSGEKIDHPASQRIYEYKKFTNVVYKKGKGYQLHCDLYVPEGNGPFPAVLAIHGGAWRHGSKVQMIRHAWKLAKAGYVVVAINYRHAPEYKFPAQVHDCKHAVRWIRSKSEKLKVDTNKIAVFGYSAGGHLSAMLGATDPEDEMEGDLSSAEKKISSRVQCVIVGGGPCEFDWIKSKVLTHWLEDTPQENPAIYEKAAPLSYVSKDDPPFIFFHGSEDVVVPLETSKKMHEKLIEVGVESHFVTIDGKGHFATFSDTTWLDQAIKFLDSKLERQHHE